MSDENRDATGQFAPTPEPAFGLEGIEREAGYVPYKDETAPIDDNSELTLQDAAEQLTQGTPESEIRTYSPVSELDDNVTLTVEQAAKIQADTEAADDAQSELDEADQIRAEVDKLREGKAEAKPEEIGKDPQADVERFLELPHVKEAVEKWNGEVEAVRQVYSEGVDRANHIARASLFEDFPEIAALPLDQWVPAVTAMSHQEPDRYNKFMGKLTRAAQLENAQQQQQLQQQEQRAEAERTRLKGETARFEEKIKDVPKARRVEVENEIIEAIKERGANMNDVVTFLHSSEASSATVMELLWELGDTRAQLKAIKNAPKAVAAKTLPHVQRPGIAGPRVTGVSAELAKAQAAFDRNPTEKTGRELLAAQSRARG